MFTLAEEEYSLNIRRNFLTINAVEHENGQMIATFQEGCVFFVFCCSFVCFSFLCLFGIFTCVCVFFFFNSDCINLIISTSMGWMVIFDVLRSIFMLFSDFKFDLTLPF